MIRPDKMTIKTQEALAEAQQTASRMGHGTIEPEHLLSSLLEQEGGRITREYTTIPCMRRIHFQTSFSWLIGEVAKV